MSTLSAFSVGISPTFPVSAEELVMRYVTAVTRVETGGVEPPTLGAGGGYSEAMRHRQRWFPWLDEKIIEPKYDGVAAFMGLPSNRPTFIKDYHTIAMMRAIDDLMKPLYTATIHAEVDTVTPEPPPIPGPDDPDFEGETDP